MRSSGRRREREGKREGKGRKGRKRKGRKRRRKERRKRRRVGDDEFDVGEIGE